MKTANREQRRRSKLILASFVALFGGVTAIEGLQLRETTPYFVGIENLGDVAGQIQFKVTLQGQ